MLPSVLRLGTKLITRSSIPSRSLSINRTRYEQVCLMSTKEMINLMTKNRMMNPTVFSRSFSINQQLLTLHPAEKLTEQEKNAYKKLFTEMDKDKDGVLSTEELKKGLQEFIGYEATATELKESMDVLDRNKDGKVDLNDFLDHMQARKIETRLEAIRFTFEMWDANSDGYIDRADIKNMFKAIGEEPTDTKIDKIMELADSDKDGKLSFKEFKNIFKDKQI